MKRFSEKKTRLLIVAAIIVLCCLCGGAWLFGRGQGIPSFTNESMEEFLDDYAEMMEKGEKENVLIVVSAERPESYGAVDVVEGPNQTYFLMYESSEVKTRAYEQLKTDTSASVDENVMMELMGYNSWGIEKMGLDDAIGAVGDSGLPVSVAVIDTGLNIEQFQSYFPDRNITAYNIEADSYDVSDMVDYNGHGTHVAGVVADGTPDNVSLYIIRVARGSSGEVYSSDVITAIYEAVNSGAKVINMSIGAYVWIDSQKAALDFAKEHNVITVAAAGNDGVSDVLYPAGYDNTLSISAINPDFELANFSNFGDTIDFAAPGAYIGSINGTMNGTSSAAPHVAAAVAILKSYNSELSFNNTKTLLTEHVQDLGEEGWDQLFGFGMIDFNDAEFCGEGYCDRFGVFAVDEPDLPEPAEVINYAEGVAELEVLDDGVMVTADEACVVAISNDEGETYTIVPASEVEGEERSYVFEFEITNETEVTVALKGDGDMDGNVTTADSNLINRSLISHSLRPYRALTALERVIFDVDGDGEITTADSNLINRSLISHSLRPYQKLAW